MKVLFGSCLVCLVIIFVWIWMSTRRVCFNSKAFGTGLACSSRVGVSLIMVLEKFIL